MKIKNILIAGGIIIVLLIVGWWWFGQSSQTVAPTATQDSTVGDFFPVEVIKNTINTIVTTTQNSLQNLISVDDGRAGETVEDQSVRQVVSEPVADYGFITYQGTSTLFYVEQETGHIFVMASGTPVRLSNKSIPRVKSVAAAENSVKYYFYIGSLDEQNNLVFQKGELLKATSSDLALTALDSRIKTLVVSPKGNQAFILKESDNGVVGQIVNLNFEVPTNVFSSPFKEWVAEWVSDDKISFQTKASSGINGSFYLLDIKTKEFTPILTNIPGLMGKLSNNTENLIYSSNNSGQTNSFIKNEGEEVYQLSIGVITDKCEWFSGNISILCGVPINSTNLNKPDSWYQGGVSFNDELWLVDIIYGEAFLADELKNKQIDISNLKSNLGSSVMYFQNKTDGSLWNFDLTSFDF